MKGPPIYHERLSISLWGWALGGGGPSLQRKWEGTSKTSLAGSGGQGRALSLKVPEQHRHVTPLHGFPTKILSGNPSTGSLSSGSEAAAAHTVTGRDPEPKTLLCPWGGSPCHALLDQRVTLSSSRQGQSSLASDLMLEPLLKLQQASGWPRGSFKQRLFSGLCPGVSGSIRQE